MTSHSAKKCWIVGRRNGVGLEQDAALVAKALMEAGWAVEGFAPRDWTALCNPCRKPDAVIHLERFFPLWKLRGGVHFLIPNQERFPLRQLRGLKRVDHVLCKSRHAEEIFAKLHRSVRFIGFTSPDRQIAGRTPDYSRIFHLAGKSTLKNTPALLELWAKHPEWPVLHLVQHPSNAPLSVPGNVELISRYMEDAELRELQNSCGIHLCPSLSEGWGHYIVEAMSCEAAILTTDAPPMNELVQPDRGVLVPWNESKPRHSGTIFSVDLAKLEEAIQDLIAQPDEEKRRLGQAARSWFEKNDSAFSANLSAALMAGRDRG